MSIIGGNEKLSIAMQMNMYGISLTTVIIGSTTVQNRTFNAEKPPEKAVFAVSEVFGPSVMKGFGKTLQTQCFESRGLRGFPVVRKCY